MLSGPALLAMATAVATFPAVAGAKRTVTAMEFPGVTVVGRVGPLKVNAVPVRLVCETVKLAFPEFFRVSV